MVYFCRVILVVLCGVVGGKGHCLSSELEKIRQELMGHSRKLPQISSSKGLFAPLLTENDCTTFELTTSSVKKLRNKLVFPVDYDESSHKPEELDAIFNLLNFLDTLHEKIMKKDQISEDFLLG